MWRPRRELNFEQRERERERTFAIPASLALSLSTQSTSTPTLPLYPQQREREREIKLLPWKNIFFRESDIGGKKRSERKRKKLEKSQFAQKIGLFSKVILVKKKKIKVVYKKSPSLPLAINLIFEEYSRIFGPFYQLLSLVFLL